MPDGALQILLAQTMRDVLEMSFFANILEETVPEPWRTGVPSIAARVEFSGAANGSFLLVATPLAASMLALEFMGDSTEDRDVEGVSVVMDKGGSTVDDEEVFKELTNILCGSVLSRFQTDRCCSLSQPVVCSGEMVEEHTTSDRGICAGTLLEDGLVAGYWKLDGIR